MFRTILLIALAIPVLLTAQVDPHLAISIPAGSRPWTSLDFQNDPDRFQFVIVTDRTGGHRAGVFPEAMEKINLLQPEFVMSVGDLIEGYSEDVDELNHQWDEFDSFVQALDMPFFYVPGNHDITNSVMDSIWRARLGPTYYHFVYRDVLFLCLNSEDQLRGSGRGTISDTQFSYIEQTLADNPDVKWTLIFLHQPLWIQKDTKRWEEVEELLAHRPHSVFAGHVHHYVKYERNNGRYFTLATTGGGSRLRGPRLGEFDHITWVTMTDEGPILANLALDGIWNEDVVLDSDYDFITKLQRIQPIQIEPLLVEGESFSNGSIRIRMDNPADYPVLVSVDPESNPQLMGLLESDTFRVQPNSVQEVSLEVRAPLPLSIKEAPRLPIAIDLLYELPDRPALGIPFQFQIAPQQQYHFADRPGSFMLNGDLSEWTDLPYELSSPNATDLSASFQLALDEKYLYVAARIVDDEIRLDTSRVAWQQDYVSFVVNADPAGRSAMDIGRGWYSNSLLLLATPETKDTPTQVFYEDREEAVRDFVCKATDGGYQIEARVPLDYIIARQGENWRSIRFNLMLQDWDSDEEDKPRFYWQPNWRGEDNLIGSGMFFRE